MFSLKFLKLIIYSLFYCTFLIHSIKYSLERSNSTVTLRLLYINFVQKNDSCILENIVLGSSFKKLNYSHYYAYGNCSVNLGMLCFNRLCPIKFNASDPRNMPQTFKISRNVTLLAYIHKDFSLLFFLSHHCINIYKHKPRTLRNNILSMI